MALKRALFFFLLVFTTCTIYILTSYPSLAFWDCSEFITCSSTLGIPHPPGNPLFLLIGRLFCLLPFGQEPAVSVHWVSALFSALGIGFFFLILCRLAREFWPDLPLDIIQISSIIMALGLAFSNTYWNNAGEAEVYNAALCLSLLSFYCFLLFYHYRKLNDLMAMLFFTGLGIGFHLLSLLWLPVFLMVIIYFKRSIRLPLPVLAVQMFFFFLVVLTLMIERTNINFLPMWSLGGLWGLTLIYLVYTGDSLETWPFWILLFQFVSLIFSLEIFLLFSGISLLLSPFMLFLSRWDRLNWKIYWAGLCSFLTGFSIFLTIPLRSSLHPAINMNEPFTWELFRNYFERKNYGSTTIFLQIIERQSEIKAQFTAYLEMIKQQISDPFLGGIYLLFLISGLIFFINWKSHISLKLLVTGCLIFSSLGLVLYLNLPAGSSLLYQDQRNRDYFFVYSFALFFLTSGIGLTLILNTIWKKLVHKRLIWILMIPLFLLPLGLFQKHYFQQNRSQNYIAYDFAYNLLMTCAPNSILFTHADNDTYPLWALQNTYHIRQDVQIITITLLNSDWYMKQVRERLGIPLTDDEIRYICWLYPKVEPIPIHFEMEDLEIFMQGRRWRKDSRYGIFFASDYMILKIIQDMYLRQPIYFANTIPANHRLVSDNNLALEGLASSLVGSLNSKIEPDKMLYNFRYVYRYNSFSDSISKSDLDMTIIRHYGTAILKLADYYLNQKNYLQAEDVLSAIQKTPLKKEWRVADRLIRIYQIQNRPDKFQTQMEIINHIPESFYHQETYTAMAEWCRLAGDTRGYLSWLERGLEQSPLNIILYQKLARIYKNRKDGQKLHILFLQAQKHLLPRQIDQIKLEL